MKKMNIKNNSTTGLLKILICSLFIFSLSAGVFSQEANDSKAAADSQSEPVASAETNNSHGAAAGSEDDQFALKSWDFFFTMGPMVYVNTDSDSAPSPVMFGGGIGFELFNQYAVNFQPKISFFTNYYLWDGENARPAEVENRTALALSCLVDFDASHTWILTNQAVQVGAGISFLGRFGMLANGVNDSDSGGTETSTAGDDVSSINSWFYQGLNCLYPNVAVSWMRQLDSKWHAGFELRLYLPLGALADGRGLDTMIGAFGVKVCSK